TKHITTQVPFGTNAKDWDKIPYPGNTHSFEDLRALPNDIEINIQSKRTAVKEVGFTLSSSPLFTKKAPGTASLDNEEEYFLRDLSIKLGSQAQFLPKDVIDYLKRHWGVNYEDMSDIYAGEKEPATFKQRIMRMLEDKKIAFVIDDLSNHEAINNTAIKYGINKFYSNGFDDYLYPRIDNLKNPLGILAFSHTLYRNKVQAENVGIISEQQYIELTKKAASAKKDIENAKVKSVASAKEIEDLEKINEEAEAEVKKYVPVFAIHLSRKVWEEYKHNNYFFAQLLFHETVEYLMGSSKEFTPHQLGVIFEMYFLSPEAKAKGISDLNLFFLKHAIDIKNVNYLNKVVREYYIKRDPTLGSFYNILWELLRGTGIELKYSRKIFLDPGFGYFGVYGKKAPVTPNYTMDEHQELEGAYRGQGTMKLVDKNIQNLVAADKIGKIHDGLLMLFEQQKIYFRIDENKGESFYKTKERLNDTLGIMFFILAVDDKYEVHISQKLWDSLEEWGKVISSDGYTRREHFLAQLMVHTYTQNFLPRIKDINIHTWADLSALHFASDEAFRAEVNDLNLYYFDYAAKINDVDYFYRFLWKYMIFRDPQATMKNAVYQAMSKIDESFLINGIKKGEDLLCYYGYLFEHNPQKIHYNDRALAITEKLNKYSVINNNIKNILQAKGNKYFYQYKYIDSKTKEEQLVYMPQNIGTLLDMVKVRDLHLMPQHINGISILEQEVEALKQKRQGKQNEKAGLYKSSSKDEINKVNQEIKAINKEINIRLGKIAKLYDAPFLDYISDKLKGSLESHINANQSCFIVGIYGPTSTGKTTLTEFLVREFAKQFGDLNAESEPKGEKVNFMSSDSYLYIGDGFRYVKQGGGRFTIVKGQTIYNLKAFTRDLANLKEGLDVYTPWDEHAPGFRKELKGQLRKINGRDLKIIFIDFTCFGIDPSVMNYVDYLIPVIFANDIVRTGRRIERDTRPKDKEGGEKDEGGDRGDSSEYVINDTVEKAFQEIYYAMRDNTTKYADLIWQQDTNKIYKINKDSSSPVTFTPHTYENGQLVVANLATEYEALAKNNPDQVHILILDAEIDGLWYRFSMPIPVNETPYVLKDYLLARLFNIFIVTGPSSLAIYVPEELKSALGDIKDLLFAKSDKGYRSILEAIGLRMHKLADAKELISIMAVKPG
ncbi:MAG: hypothetical protein WC315_09030, partial [Candidatus Omnitrophota bacterium]